MKLKKVRKNQYKEGVYSGDIKEPLYGSTYLPRKFKCAVTVPGDNSVDLLTQDIGLVVFTNAKNKLIGCNVYVGGGMGRTHNNEETFARSAEPIGFVSAEYVLELVQSILALQRDYGDRKVRRHARMKYLINDKGIEWFIDKLKNNYFKYPIKSLRKEPTSKLLDYLGWHKQSHDLYFVGIPLLSGRLSGEYKKAICKLVNKFKLDIQLTPNQDLLLCNIGSYQRSSIKKELSNIGIIKPDSPEPIQRHALACPALPLCGLAVTEAERILPEILDRINTQLSDLRIQKTLLFRMTGCPNGCARPYMAELALVGSGLDQYQLWLGGSPNLQRLAKPFIQRMPLTSLEETLKPLFISWKNSKKEISFGDHMNELGDQNIMELLSLKDKEP